jgi:hypothetical protein
MTLAYRVYVIEGDAISPVAQRTFHHFFFREERTLQAYSGQTLTFAMPTYETENRRPVRVVRLDTLRLTVRADGSMDQDQYFRHLVHAVAAVDTDTADPAGAKLLESAKKRRENRSPEISEKAYRSILAHLNLP